ncbi:tetratricopeptide repeat protein [Limnothrix redekei]|uniref:Tetratricopeptide repeat protein n=1 Tax=Limnothrix redekei LRLZ20PSL1 TaxID=3112953 RepID=A0ABW7CDS0_9CYAN
MEDSVGIVYISILVGLLSIVAFFVLRQVFKTRRLESTLSRLQKAASSGEAGAQAFYELGSIYMDKKMYGQAIEQFQRSLKKGEEESTDNLAIVYNALGFAYIAQEQFDLAIRQYKEAVKLNSGYVTAWNNLGFAYEKKQLVKQALEAYEAALAADPKNGVAKRRLESLQKRA